MTEMMVGVGLFSFFSNLLSLCLWGLVELPNMVGLWR